MNIYDYPKLQLLTDETLRPNTADTELKRKGVLCQAILQQQNVSYANSGGVSNGNRQVGFVPGFYNQFSGEMIRSRFADGSPAPIHVLDGLPVHWAQKRDHHSHVLETRPGVIAGFIRDGRFYSREEVALLIAH